MLFYAFIVKFKSLICDTIFSLLDFLAYGIRRQMIKCNESQVFIFKSNFNEMCVHLEQQTGSLNATSLHLNPNKFFFLHAIFCIYSKIQKSYL